MELYLYFFGILLIHWIADFVLQKDEDAKGKSTSIKHLLSHTYGYSLCWLLVVSFLYAFDYLPLVFFLFPFITFVIHTITDYFTSKWVSRLWKEQKVHEFFIVIGFDQLLHYVQLYGTFFLLLNL